MPTVYSACSDAGKGQQTNHPGRSPLAPGTRSLIAPRSAQPGCQPTGLLQPRSLLGTGHAGTGPSSWRGQCELPGQQTAWAAAGIHLAPSRHRLGVRMMLAALPLRARHVLPPCCCEDAATQII